jgi:hypothetical protein
MEKLFVTSISGREGYIKVYEDLPILQMRNEDFALPNAPEHLINCEDGVNVYPYLQFVIPNQLGWTVFYTVYLLYFSTGGHKHEGYLVNIPTAGNRYTEDLDPLLDKIATRHLEKSMDLIKTTIWGEEDHHWEFRCIGEPTNDVGDAYEGFLNGVSQGVKLLVTWQKMLLSEYNPFSI